MPRLVRDIRPGPESSLPSNLIAVGSRVCFTADDGVHQTEWWTSDGTQAGTRLVKDVVGSGHYMVVKDSMQAVVDRVLYFTFVSDDAELWRTDCTAKGTYRVKDIRKGPIGSHPSDLTAVGKQFFFVANDGQRGFELWKSDGTEKGTVPVRSLAAQPTQERAALEGRVELRGQPSARQRAAIGKALSYAEVAIGSGPRPERLHAVGDSLVYSFDDGVHGSELWVSDGTDAGTHLLKETRPGKDSIVPWHMQPAGRLLYFRSLAGSPSTELWRTDGTADGTRLVRSLPVGLSSGGWVQAGFSESVVFSLEGKNLATQLWTSDGTEQGTKQLALEGVPSAAATSKGIFLLANAQKGAPSGLYELRSGAPQRIAELPKPAADGSYRSLVAAGDRVFFSESALGQPLRGIWTSDGTQEGTFKLGDFADYGKHGGFHLAAVGQRVYFTAARSAGDVELWSIDF